MRPERIVAIVFTIIALALAGIRLPGIGPFQPGAQRVSG